MSEKEGLGSERRESSDRHSGTSHPAESSRRFSEADVQTRTDDLEEDDEGSVTQFRGIAEKALAHELSNCVTCCQATKFQSFSHARENFTVANMCSFSEAKAEKLITSKGADFVAHNKKFLSRIYPSAHRVLSGNYNPCKMWAVGCQLVALNYQSGDSESGDTSLQMNDGLFRQNGGSGFILKPSILRDPAILFEPKGPYPKEWARKLKLKIISACQLPKPLEDEKRGGKGEIIDPFVKVKIYGVASDKKTLSTVYVDDNGFNPQWNHDMEFDVSVPAVAMVQLKVLDKDFHNEDFIGQVCIPFNSLQQGYRHVTLLSGSGSPLAPACLFVHVEIEKSM